jgi:Putative metal-binding motif
VPRAGSEEEPVVLRRALLLAFAAVLLVPATASAGLFTVDDRTLTYTGDSGQDKISGIDTGFSYRFTRFGGDEIQGECNVSPDFQSIDCPKDAIDTVVLNLNGGDDVASIAGNVHIPVRFVGGGGNDGLFGGGGSDTFFGEDGDDNIVSRDNQSEFVDCGAGHDTAISDDGDFRTSCEEIEGDADFDGVRRPADCNDANAGIRPGFADVPDDGIDQDCSGADATNLDADGDGSQRPLDCDDRNAKIKPGAKEIVGNRTDENCDTEAVPFRGIGGIVRNRWAPSGATTANRTLSARELPRGTRIKMKCSGAGCPFRTITRRVRNKRPVNLHKPFGNAGLGRGARVELSLTRAGRIGRVLRYRMTATPGVPSVGLLCRPPGGRTRAC